MSDTLTVVVTRENRHTGVEVVCIDSQHVCALRMYELAEFGELVSVTGIQHLHLVGLMVEQRVDLLAADAEDFV